MISKIRQIIKSTRYSNRKIYELEHQVEFLLKELSKLKERIRYSELSQRDLDEVYKMQTKSSFDYQWKDFNSGANLPGDKKFMDGVGELVCKMVNVNKEWFEGKKVIDIGCGTGRFSYGLLSLGATVTSVDQSENALLNTRKICEKFAERHTTVRKDLLDWSDEMDNDLAFCFGVVHHTGNTYRAILNVAKKVKPGGKLFLMIYGFPLVDKEFQMINRYERLRTKLRNVPFEEKKTYLINEFGEIKAHGYFDAVSPEENDILTFEEIENFLLKLGFANVKRTVDHENHHIVADRILNN